MSEPGRLEVTIAAFGLYASRAYFRMHWRLVAVWLDPRIGPPVRPWPKPDMHYQHTAMLVIAPNTSSDSRASTTPVSELSKSL